MSKHYTVLAVCCTFFIIGAAIADFVYLNNKGAADVCFWSLLIILFALSQIYLHWPRKTK